MTTPGNWAQTPAGLLANHGLAVELPFEARRREFESAEHRQAVADYQAAVDADPSWKFSRETQRALVARGWPGQVLAVESSVPAALRPLHAAQAAASAISWSQQRRAG